MIYNPDGSPMTDSQKSSEVKTNKSTMASISSTMSSAKSYYSKGNSLLSSYDMAKSSIDSDSFAVNKTGKKNNITANMLGIKGIQRSMLTSHTKMSSAYDRLNQRNDVLVNGTIGGQIAKHDQEKREAQSSQAVQLRIQSDPQFSMEYSASLSTSASFADLPQSKQSSLLNSYAENERIRKNGNMFGYQGQDLPTGTLNAIQNGTYNEAKNKRGNKK